MNDRSFQKQPGHAHSSPELITLSLPTTKQGRIVADLEAVKTFMGETLYGADGMRVYLKGKEIGSYSAHEHEHPVDIASCTKSIAAIAIFKAVELKLVALDDKISERLPDYKHLQETPYNQITIRHLLTHTSGYPGNVFFHPANKKLWTPGDKQFFPGEAGYLDLNRRASSHKLEYPVGNRYDYSNPGVQVLSAVLESALAKSNFKSVDEFVCKKIFEPLEMSNSALSKKGEVTMLYGGMQSTSADLAKLGLWVIYALGGKSAVLTRDSVESMLSKPTIPGWTWKEPLGHLWWNYEDLGGHAASGDRENFVFVVPEDELVISRTKGPDGEYSELPFQHLNKSLITLKEALRSAIT